MKLWNVIFFAAGLSTAAAFGSPPGTMNDLVDIPAADILDHGSFESNFRFFTDGGLVTKLNFGVFRILNVGFSLTVDKFIGNEKTDLQQPELQVKIRLFQGNPGLPSLAIGFDSQGYRFNKERDRYTDEERGLYLAASQEVFWPSLFLHGGIAVADFDDDKVIGFFGLHYDIQERVALFTEYDNLRSFDKNRLNAGFRVFVTPSFNVDFAVRDIGAGGTVDGFRRYHERIIRLEYVGAF